ncbi:MAG: alpha/beta hydrolase [Spirochaetota bacterium]
MNSLIEERTFAGNDGTHLFFRSVRPQDPKGVIVIVHGYGEHSGRYVATMQRFAEGGYAVYCMDLRGFGRNTTLLGYLRDSSEIVSDLSLLTELAAREVPERGTTLLGHSMGGLIALKQLLEHQGAYDAAITSGPALLPPPNTSKTVIALAGLLSRIVPRVPVSQMEKAKGTRNEEVLEHDRIDPLFYDGGFRARTGHELLKLQVEVTGRLGEITIPLLALHGEGDLLIDPRATEILYEGVGSEDKTKVVFPVLYHEVLNEPEREIVFVKIFEWLEPRLTAGA